MKTIFKKILSVTVAMLLTGLYASAAPHSTVTLKDGSVIEGDIIVQRPGKDLTIASENAKFVIKPADISSKRSRKVKYENLSREWKRWALQNQALTGDAYGRYAELYDIKTGKYTFTDIALDKKNDNTYVQVAPSTYKLNWNDISEIKKNEVKGAKDYLDDVIITRTGKKYTGKIVSQRPGDSYMVDNGSTTTKVKTADVVETRKEKTGNTSYFDQVDYTNKLILKDGTEKDGLILGIHQGSADKDRYVNFMNSNGKVEKVTSSNISEYRTSFDKMERETYLPDKVYVNEFRIEPAKTGAQGDILTFLDKKVFPFPEGIEITFKSNSSKLAGNWQLIALDEVSLKSGGTTWGYNPDKKDDQTVPVKLNEAQGSLGIITYGYLSPGYYALVNGNDTECYIIKIIK